MKGKFDKYNCPICQCILNYPVTLTKCFHEFCLQCIQSYIKTNYQNNQPLTCPLCRKEFKKYDYVMATDLQKEIENCTTRCTCGELIPIPLYEDHLEKCKKKEKKEDGSVKGDYNCTLCERKGMNRQEYVDHIRDKHTEEEGVCAICSVQPWGDKEYKTYLLGHVDLRHKRDITERDENKKELELLKKVLELSKNDK